MTSSMPVAWVFFCSWIALIRFQLVLVSVNVSGEPLWKLRLCWTIMC